MQTFKLFVEGAEEHEKLKDHTKNPYHKVLTQHGFTHASTEHKQNYLAKNNPKADYTEHHYVHPDHTDKVTVTQDHAKFHRNDKLNSWRHLHIQSNKILSPTTGETKPSLDRHLHDMTTERKRGLTEGVSASEKELAAPSDAILLRHGYEPTGNRVKEGKFRQFSYKHPNGSVAHTFVNPSASPEQQVQHQINKQFVHHSNLESALALKR